MGTWSRCNWSCRLCQHNFSLAADHLKVTLRSGWKVVYFRLWARVLPWQPFMGLALAGTWAELGVAWEAAGTQVPRPEQLPPLSDKERFVVLSPFPPTRTSISLALFTSLSPLSSLPLFLLGLWSRIGFAGRMTEAGSAQRHRRGWGGPQGWGQGCPQCSLFSWACVISGLAWPCSHRAWLSALTLIMVYLSDWPSHNSLGPLITEAGVEAADWSPAWIQPRAQWHHVFIHKSQRCPSPCPQAGSWPLTPSILSSKITEFHFSWHLILLFSTRNWLKSRELEPPKQQ